MISALNGRVILITGAGVGIGRGIAERCHAAGATVVTGTLEATDAYYSERLEVHPLDVCDPQAITQWVMQAADKHGRIDGLVANAGVTLTPKFLDADLESLETLWQVNQRGVFLSVQAVARAMINLRTPGSIVTIASNHARASDSGYEMYAATKGAIVSMTRALAWSLGSHAIRINSLSPGLTRTEAVATAAAQDADTEAMFQQWHATGRYNTVAEVAECAMFLLSDASSSMSGSDMLADQGMAARLVDFK